jgi:D-glycero-D-manno-heptose 1,7-bisphosphate phosphatase
VRPAAFIDRDGTLIEERHYLAALDDVVLFPGSVEALRLLRDAGLALVVVSNQSGVARGFFDEAFVRRVHAHLDARLGAHGIRVDGYYYCPHHPEGAVEPYRRACDCRKPAPGLVQAAARDLGLDLPRSYVVGDKWTDVELAAQVGAAGLLVRSGHGADAGVSPEGVAPAAVVATLLDAARWIVDRQRVHVGPGDLR